MRDNISLTHLQYIQFGIHDYGRREQKGTDNPVVDGPPINYGGELPKGSLSLDLSRFLHQLARDGKHNLLEMSLDRLGDRGNQRINQRDKDSLAPLHYAARYDHAQTVKVLLQRSCEVDIKGKSNFTPLHFAARYRKPRQAVQKKCDGNLTRFNNKMVSKNVTGMRNGSKGFEDNVLDSVVKLLVDNGANINARSNIGLTPLHCAVMRGNDEITGDLLAYEKINIEARDKHLMTPLLIATTYGYLNICQRLIEAGANIHAINESQQTALHIAAAEGYLEIVKLVLSVAFKQGGTIAMRSLLGMQDYIKQIPLHLAITNGNNDTAELLIEKGSNVNALTETSTSPLHACAAIGNKELTALLIDHGAVVDSINQDEQSPLHLAAYNNHCGVIELLLQNHADIESRDTDFSTPLLIAASSGHVEALEMLVSKGASVNATGKDDRNALFCCTSKGDTKAIKMLMEYLCDSLINDMSDNFDNSLLHEAARHGHVEIVKILLDHGSKIDKKNEEKDTPLHIAAKEGQNNVAKELVSRSQFLVYDENEDGNTPLHLASLRGHSAVVATLLDANANVSIRNTSNWTPLHCASYDGHLDVCKLLIDYNPSLHPLETKTASLQLAARRGHVDVTHYLIQQGALVSALDAYFRNTLEQAIDCGHQDVAMAIIQSDQWLQGLRNIREDADGKRITPFRLLIQNFPVVAKMALDKCITTGECDKEEEKYELKFDFEFIDDTYVVQSKDKMDTDFSSSGCSYEFPYDDQGKCAKTAVPYTKNLKNLKTDHPLMLMVKYQQTDLLGHPVSVSLVNHKWNNYARYAYYYNIVIYCIFLGFFTGYALNLIDWQYADVLIEQHNMTASYLPGVYEAYMMILQEKECNPLCCSEVNDILIENGRPFLILSPVILLIYSPLSIIKLIYQLRQTCLGKRWEISHVIEMVCYTFGAFFIFNISSGERCFDKKAWEWDLAAIIIYLSWLRLILYLKKLPLFGIYVIMFTDIFFTFSKFSVVFFVFIMGFAFSFYMLLRPQLPFESFWKSVLKITVMMTGEFEHDSIFYNPNNPIKNSHSSFALSLLFVIFLVVMSLIIMNLMIGLAVDDIKLVKNEAVQKYRAMNAHLVMTADILIPATIRRRYSRSFVKLFPTKRHPIYKCLSDNAQHHLENVRIAL